MEALITVSAFQFYLIAIAAMLLHAVKKWAYKEIRGSLVDWYIVHPRASLASFLACMGGIMTAILTGTLTDPHQGAQVLAAFGIGIGSDSLNTQGKQNG